MAQNEMVFRRKSQYNLAVGGDQTWDTSIDRQVSYDSSMLVYKICLSTWLRSTSGLPCLLKRHMGGKNFSLVVGNKGQTSLFSVTVLRMLCP